MNISITKILSMCLVIMALASCQSSKHITYLQDVPEHYSEKINDSYESKIKNDDLIAIMVNSRDIELAQMFNLPMVSYQTGTKISGQNMVLGYLVDRQGNIDFPLLGSIHVAGMTRNELTSYIKSQLIEKGLVNDPIVTVQYLNYQVSVIGEVTRPGSFEVSSDRITIFDALSQAGDLTIYGLRDKVKVIREENGRRTVATVNLLTDEILTSPYYYLQQNDVVYVEPNKAKAGQREINSNRTIGTFASVISVVLSILAFIV